MAAQLRLPCLTTPSADFFAQAYTLGFRQTVRFLLAKGAQPHVAEETAQAAWVRGWEARDQLRLKERILPWVNTIAFRQLCNDRRRSGRHSELTDWPDERPYEPIVLVDAKILLNQCSPFEKTLMEERYLDGLDMREIAATRGLSEGAVRLRIHRCRKVLRSIACRADRCGLSLAT